MPRSLSSSTSLADAREETSEDSAEEADIEPAIGAAEDGSEVR